MNISWPPSFFLYCNSRWARVILRSKGLKRCGPRAHSPSSTNTRLCSRKWCKVVYKLRETGSSFEILQPPSIYGRQEDTCETNPKTEQKHRKGLLLGPSLSPVCSRLIQCAGMPRVVFPCAIIMAPFTACWWLIVWSNHQKESFRRKNFNEFVKIQEFSSFVTILR